MTGASPGPLGDRAEVRTDGRVAYTNTLNPSLATLNRVSPPDQAYNGGGIGYFDVVDVPTTGTFAGWFDPVDAVISDEGGNHNIRYQATFFTGLPELTTVNSIAPGTVGDGHTGVMYPYPMFFYAYLFGEGQGSDASGAPYLAGEGLFAGLVDADACAARATERCQLIAPADLDGIGPGGSAAQICGWNPFSHSHPSADVLACRDYDFSFRSDNTEQVRGQDQLKSPFFVWGNTPGWYSNVQLIPGILPAQTSPENFGTTQTDYAARHAIHHFTVGAEFDADVEANGGIDANGDGAIDCLEPGFNPEAFLAHDLDIYDPPNMALAPVLGNLDAITDELGPVGDLAEQVEDTALEIANQGTGVVTEERAPFEEKAYPEDTGGDLSASTALRLECVDAEGDHDFRGYIDAVPGETTINHVGPTVWQGVPQTLGLQSFIDPVEALNPDDDHENPGGGVAFYFSEPNNGRPGLGEWSSAEADVAFYDGLYDVGEGCETAGSFGNTCIGDFMFDKGYRDPTSLVFVMEMAGPVTFLNWNAPTEAAFAPYADAAKHCVIGASKGVFDASGQSLTESQVFEAVLDRVAPGTILAGSAANVKETLRQTLCPDSLTLDYFPGQGFYDHPDGGSVSSPLGWVVPTTWAQEDKGRLDVFYVLSVDATLGLKGDKLGLEGLTVGDPTVVDTDNGSVTMVWQDVTEFGSKA